MWGLALTALIVAAVSASAGCSGDDVAAVDSADGGGVDSGTGDGGSSSGGVAEQAAAPTFSPDPVGKTFTSAQTVTLASATPGATIYFTTDGTNPSTASVVFSKPITVATTTTIRAMAAADKHLDSPVSSATYTVEIPPEKTKPVTFTKPAGEYSSALEVGLTTETSPSIICFTLDGTAPTCDAATGTCSNTAVKYSAGSPIPVDAPVGGGDAVIHAIACSAGKDDSDVTSATYAFRAAKPTMSPAPGELSLGTTLTLETATATSDANPVTLRYNLNGGQTDLTDPSCALSDETIAGQAGTISLQQNTTVKAIACRPNYLPSIVDSQSTFAYTVKLNKPSLTGGVFHNDVAVDVTDGASPNRTLPTSFTQPTPSPTPTAGTFCYRLDGAPGCTAAGACDADSTATAPTITSNDENTAQVITCRPGYAPSEVASATYTLAVAPVAIAGAGSNLVPDYEDTSGPNWWKAGGGNETFTFQTATDGESIRFATATSAEPADLTCSQACAGDAACTSCDAATVEAGNCKATVAPFTTIKAIACKGTAYDPSMIRKLTYADPTDVVTLALPTPDPAVTYANDQEITLTASPANATICYSIDNPNNTAPECDVQTGACAQGLTYDPGHKPVVSRDGDKIRAIACKAGVPAASSEVPAIYRFRVATPSFQYPAGAAAPGTIPYGATIDFVTATNDSGANTVKFAQTSGQPQAFDPTCSSASAATSNVFDDASSAPTGEWRLIACKTGYQPSVITAQAFSANLEQPTISVSPANPNAHPPYDVFDNEATVTLSSTSLGATGGKICYPTDGGVPACDNTSPTIACGGTGVVTQYSAPFVVATDNTTVRAITCANGYGAGSTVLETNLRFKADAPVLAPSDGTDSSGMDIWLKNGATDGATLCWSTDDTPIPEDCAAGGGVTCESKSAGEFTGTNPLLPNHATNVVVRARVCKADFASSEEVRNPYLFNAYARTIVIDGSNDWSTEDNALLSASFAGYGVQKTYVAWDADYVYFASQGPVFNLTSGAGTFFHAYLKSSANAGTKTTDTVPLSPNFSTVGAPNPDMNANVHVYFEANGSANNGVRVYTTDWGGPLTGYEKGADYDVSFGAFGTSAAIVEFRISRAQLGLTEDNSTLSFFSFFTQSNHSVYEVSPVNASFTSWGHLTANMSAAKVPNHSGNLFFP